LLQSLNKNQPGVSVAGGWFEGFRIIEQRKFQISVKAEAKLKQKSHGVRKTP